MKDRFQFPGNGVGLSISSGFRQKTTKEIFSENNKNSNSRCFSENLPFVCVSVIESKCEGRKKTYGFERQTFYDFGFSDVCFNVLQLFIQNRGT